MTAQIHNTILYDGQELSIIEGAKIIEFYPREYELDPSMVVTSCWNGYWCNYEVAGDRLVLKNLFIHTRDDSYPDLAGVSVLPVQYVEHECYTIRNGEGAMERRLEPAHNGHREYRDVGLPVGADGVLLAGDGFDHRYYVHMGWQYPWAYERLYELEFKHGRLVRVEDKSAWAAEQRAAYDAEPRGRDDLF